jgi:YesN/AraC family two-component response regulator
VAKETALLIDDESLILTAMKRDLSGVPCQVLTASSADEGLRVLAEHTVQVVVSDVSMPVTSGIELIAVRAMMSIWDFMEKVALEKN